MVIARAERHDDALGVCIIDIYYFVVAAADELTCLARIPVKISLRLVLRVRMDRLVCFDVEKLNRLIVCRVYNVIVVQPIPFDEVRALILV